VNAQDLFEGYSLFLAGLFMWGRKKAASGCAGCWGVRFIGRQALWRFCLMFVVCECKMGTLKNSLF